MDALIEKTVVGYQCWTSEDLLLEYRATGNRELFETLVHRYEGELLSYLCKKVSSREVAEDIFQQTFCQIHLRCETFEEGRTFSTWMYRIAANLVVDHYRQAKKHTRLSLDAPADSEGECSLSDTLVANVPEPSESMEKAEEIAFVREAVRHLPEIYRTILELVCYRGMTYRQAADELEVSVKTVASRICSAKKRLAVALSVRGFQK